MRSIRRTCCSIFTALLLASGDVVAVRGEDPAAEVSKAVSPEHARRAALGLKQFREGVQTILVSKCLDCHGKESVEGRFDLSDREGLLKGGESGKAIVPGDSKNSLLMKLVRHERQPRMPYEMDKLTDAEIARLASWIDNEAPYAEPLLKGKQRPEAISWTERTLPANAREHWAFRPLSNATPPSVQNAEWCRTPVDRFLLAKMESAGLAPQSAIGRRAAIRRASFALRGLPPTPEQLEEFVGDASPDAHARMIDRLLNSPHYGERWARHWLDLARFAESHGFEHDYDRPTAYHFRDFVIQALNDDLPYDEFIRWQLAGDEIAPGSNLAMMATGFLAAGVHSTQITANEVEKHRYDELDDMLATAGTAMLGLTIGCARCHDHKFDPIPQADYYRLLSHFTTTVRSEVERDFDPEAYRKAKSRFDREQAPRIAARERYEKESLPSRLAEWEKNRPDEPASDWILLELTETRSEGGTTFTPQGDGSLLASGKNPPNDVYTFAAVTDRRNVTGIRLEALSHPSFVKGGPGRAGNGNFDLTDFRVSAAPKNGKSPAVDVKLGKATATFEQVGLPVSAAIDSNPSSGWAIDPQFGKDHAASFEAVAPFGFEGGTVLRFTLAFKGNTGHQIGRLRLALTTAPMPVALEGAAAPAGIVTALGTAAAQRTPDQSRELLKWFRHRDEGWQELDRIVQEFEAQSPKPNLVKVLVSTEGLPAVRLHTQGADFFNETYFLRRGETSQKQGVALPGFLQVATQAASHDGLWSKQPPPGSPLSFRRTNLADWITDSEHGAGHLLARVAVNRLWQHHFGKGLVATPSDFGTRGAPPSHPELLDWLAGELIRQRWRLKPIHRLILNSAAWQQSSRSDPLRLRIDPENRLFWRPAFERLEGEVIRDAMLAVSGRLDQRMFGPGTLDESMRRRSVYFTVKRSQLVPMMQVFDQPEPLVGVGDRPATTIAPQALVLLNNRQTREHAGALANMLMSMKREVVIERAYLQTLSRPPSPAESTDARAFLDRQQAAYRAMNHPAPEAIALVDFCQVLFCLNEFVYLD